MFDKLQLIMLIVWGIFSCLLILSPSLILHLVPRTEIPFSRRAALFFRIIGILSLLGVVLSLVARRR